MKEIIYVIVFWVLIIPLTIAQHIGGEWKGYLDQSSEASKMDSYKSYWEKGLWAKNKKTHDLKLTFRYDYKKKKYTGEYYINESVSKSHYARFGFDATFENKKAYYKTTEKIFETKNTLNLGFCFSEATLNYTEDDRYEYLEGEWKGWNDNNRACAGAHIWVRRRKYTREEPKTEPIIIEEKKELVEEEVLVIVEQKDTIVEQKNVIVETIQTPLQENTLDIDYKDRKIVTKDLMHVDKDSVELEIWDSNREDGDIVSLELNGQLILQNYTLTNAKKVLKVYLQKGENVLILIAHNLGEIPPNTAAISIERDEGKKRVVLESDMGTSQSIKIIRK